MSRRRFLAAAAASALPAWTQDRYPARRSQQFTLDRPVTPERLAASHNIFDEFSGARDDVAAKAAKFRTSPWLITITGLVDRPREIDLEDLVNRMDLEERLYRHRCVETWAMAVPWTGFPLRKLLDFAKPQRSARYLRMVSFNRPAEAPAWFATRRRFPYYEALTLEEAANDLAFLATGIYGHRLPPQHGAPIRLAVPWKYGFKSIKSIARFEFLAERPGTFWNDLAPKNYAWESNVDPTVARPWPQHRERMLGETESRETLAYNGYADQVARLYR